jgi:hypothetical protein
VRVELAESGMNEPIGAVTPESIMAFVETVMDVLEQKFNGKPIAKTVRRLTKSANAFNVYDEGQFLDIQEPSEVFWSVEYDFLFAKMDKSIGGGGWLNAVGRCADEDCMKFFISHRRISVTTLMRAVPARRIGRRTVNAAGDERTQGVVDHVCVHKCLLVGRIWLSRKCAGNGPVRADH